MSGLPPITDPNVLVGTSTADDAGVYRISDDLALIQTVDFFTPIADDPYWFGAIAAANALSDVYAMGGEPLSALNIVCFPRASDELPLSVLGEILRGGADKAKEAGIDIVGGHTIDDAEPKYGLAVTGRVHPDAIWRNVGAQPGDRLVLTKPIGTGILSTAIRAGCASKEQEQSALAVMATLNKQAAEAARGIAIHACTDITGFGLLGHVREMLGPGGIGVRMRFSDVPLFDGAAALLSQGQLPGGTRRNLSAARQDLSPHAEITEEDLLLLADAQTSGGLLFAVAESDAAALLTALRKAGTPAAAEIGVVVEQPAGARIHIDP